MGDQGKITYIFHMVCVRAHSRQYSASCSGVMLLLLLLLLVVRVVVAYSALCVSGSMLFLALFPPCPILQSVDQVTVLCVLSIHPSYTTPTTTLFTTPQLLKPPNRYTHARTRTEAAALLSGPTCSGTTGKWLLLLLVRNQWS